MNLKGLSFFFLVLYPALCLSEDVTVIGMQTDGIPTTATYLKKKFILNPTNTTICIRFKMLWRRQPVGSLLSVSSNFTDEFIAICKLFFQFDRFDHSVKYFRFSWH